MNRKIVAKELVEISKLLIAGTWGLDVISDKDLPKFSKALSKFNKEHGSDSYFSAARELFRLPSKLKSGVRKTDLTHDIHDLIKTTKRNVKRGVGNESEYDWLEVWQHGNDAGDGYAAGEATHSPDEAAKAEGWQILDKDKTGNVLTKQPDGTITVIADLYGPWAVDVSAQKIIKDMETIAKVLYSELD